MQRSSSYNSSNQASSSSSSSTHLNDSNEESTETYFTGMWDDPLSSNLDFFGAYSQEMEWYLHNRHGYRLYSHYGASRMNKNKNVKSSNNNIVLDPIEEFIPGQCNVCKLFKWVCDSNYLHHAAFDAIRYVLPDEYDLDAFLKRKNRQWNLPKKTLQESRTPETASLEKFISLGMKKKIFNKMPSTLPAFMAEVMRNMPVRKLMFEIRSHNKKWNFSWQSATVPRFAFASNFLVQKHGSICPHTGNDLYRFIVDARWTNCLYNPAGDGYSVFTLEHLCQVIHNLSVHPEFYVINCDVRHMYHQVPLPERYREQFIMLMKNGKDVEYWLPRLLPMGWVKSPPIAQAITWAFLLSSDTGRWSDADLGLERDRIKTFTETPRWIPLTGGGGIFVLLDNILIVTPHKKIRDNWFEMIYRKSGKTHLILKAKPANKTDPPLTPFTPEYRQALEQQTLFTMKSGCKEFDFFGIQWGYDYHYLKVDEDEHGSPLGTQPDGTWQGTHRELASILGKLNWYRRVVGKRMLSTDDPAAVAINTAYSVVTPPQNQWSRPLRDGLAAHCFKPIHDEWMERAQQRHQAAVPLNKELKSILLTATDASSSRQKAAAVFFGSSCLDATSEVWDQGFSQRQIALAELFAILKTIEDSRCHNKDLIILATDSLTCKAWIERSCSPNEDADKMVQQIHAMLSAREQRLYLVYIHTSRNAADDPSRNKEFNQTQLEETYKRLLVAAEECKSLWWTAGNRMGASKRIEK